MIATLPRSHVAECCVRFPGARLTICEHSPVNPLEHAVNNWPRHSGVGLLLRCEWGKNVTEAEHAIVMKFARNANRALQFCSSGTIMRLGVVHVYTHAWASSMKGGESLVRIFVVDALGKHFLPMVFFDERAHAYDDMHLAIAHWNGGVER